ncbi:hypothetical protein jhhlp_003809 [Lomentospora prolificans]|uniref:Acyl-CoA thioesterase II domain-containing protein n=1 Tax=Lomentospora prolificans TaxID=41688 RepID=A0A2N3N9T0_9PEZI|nr:hypothetical protein jhhlp_003809 [Lomentospora prolificans]
MSGNGRATLLRPPPEDLTKSPLENALEIVELGVLGPDMFTNARQAWHPPGARGIFGGVPIAQTIAAGQRTVEEGFVIHSCHCYFLLAGSNSIPITYHVERVRDGRSFATRTVQARQRGKCIFTTTMSFVRVGSGGKKQIRHAVDMGDQKLDGPVESTDVIEWKGVEITDEGAAPDKRKCKHWVRAKGKITGGQAAHIEALAYMTDSYFLGTIPRIHDLYKPPPPSSPANLQIHGVSAVKQAPVADKPKLGMMVSLDHSIYFHEPAAIRADEWMYAEMESPWAGDGRGVVTQRVFSADGTLLATCVQEGVLRLKQDEEESKAKL